MLLTMVTGEGRNGQLPTTIAAAGKQIPSRPSTHVKPQTKQIRCLVVRLRGARQPLHNHELNARVNLLRAE
jgi:hypothetical protein